MSGTTRKACDCIPINDTKNLYSLPFFTQFSNDKSNCNQECTQNLNVTPHGPMIPTRPIFPAALPPSYSSYPTTIDAQFITVRQQACMCDLRVSCLTVNGGLLNTDGSGGTMLKLKNLPKANNPNTVLYNLVIDDSGKVYRTDSI